MATASSTALHPSLRLGLEDAMVDRWTRNMVEGGMWTAARGDVCGRRVVAAYGVERDACVDGWLLSPALPCCSTLPGLPHAVLQRVRTRGSLWPCCGCCGGCTRVEILVYVVAVAETAHAWKSLALLQLLRRLHRLGVCGPCFRTVTLDLEQVMSGERSSWYAQASACMRAWLLARACTFARMHGVRCIVLGAWCVHAWGMAHGALRTVHVCMLHGPWCMAYGAWCMVLGAWYKHAWCMHACTLHGACCTVHGACMLAGMD
eukprot:365641-Chlamydomonas_euryale.AAC.4